MRSLLERLENLEEYNKGVVVATKELPTSVQKVLKKVGFKKRDINVTPQEEVSMQAFSNDGERSFGKNAR